MVKVRATSMGYYGTVREVGDVFDFNSELPFWVELVGDVSTDSSTVIENSPAPLKEPVASVKMVKVRALSMGYDGTVREAGDEFYIDETSYPQLPSWLELVDAPTDVEPTPTPRKRKKSQQLEVASPENVDERINNAVVEQAADAIEPQTEAQVETQTEPNIEAELSA